MWYPTAQDHLAGKRTDQATGLLAYNMQQAVITLRADSCLIAFDESLAAGSLPFPSPGPPAPSLSFS